MSRPQLSDNLAREIKELQEKVKALETKAAPSIVTGTALTPAQKYQYKSGGLPGRAGPVIPSTAMPHKMLDTLDAPMDITVTPPADGLWSTCGWAIFNTLNAPWNAVRMTVSIAPADADGFTNKSELDTRVALNTGWSNINISSTFDLKKDITYIASLYITTIYAASGTPSAYYWQGAPYLGLEGQFEFY